MRKQIFTLLILTVFSLGTFAQVSINTDGSDPDPSAGLDVKFTDKGFLPPRMTEVERDAINSPAAGLIIFNTTNNSLDFFNGVKWISIDEMGVTAQNLAPDASGVSFSGLLISGETLNGSYTYSDYENDPEGTSTFKWYRADDVLGTNQLEISGAMAATYDLAGADEEKYIAFEVTPVASSGTSPGNAVMSAYNGPVTAPVFVCGTTLVDSRDGKSYPTVQYGTQCWMTENLAYLPSVVGPGTGSLTTAYNYVYGYDGTDVNTAKATQNYQDYGSLYNYSAALTACPDGWSLPEHDEWTVLFSYLSDNGSNNCNAVNGNISKSLAAASNLWTNWAFNTCATGYDAVNTNNASGFAALPGGKRISSGSFGSINTEALFWTSSPTTANFAYLRQITYNTASPFTPNLLRDNAYNVRCVKNLAD